MIKFAFSNLLRHKVRTFLSLAGVIIGVASLIALVSIVDGIRFDIEDAITSVQGVRVAPLNSTDPVLNYLDSEIVEKLDKIQGVKTAIPLVMQIPKTIEGESISYGGIRFVGFGLDKMTNTTQFTFSGTLITGRDLEISDKDKHVILIGETLQKEYKKSVGSKLKINDVSFKIIGVFTTGSDLTNNVIIGPIDAVREVTNYPKDRVSAINLVLTNPSQDGLVSKRVNLLYGSDVKASSMSDFSAQFGAIFDGITLLVVVLASIASIVSAVGIINTMLMSVLERFKEIGALKAVGWTNSNIMGLIVYESVFIGIIGGVLGLIFGYLLSIVITFFGLTTIISFELFLGSFMGALFIGLIAGIYPAFIASKTDPIEALQTE